MAALSPRWSFGPIRLSNVPGMTERDLAEPKTDETAMPVPGASDTVPTTGDWWREAVVYQIYPRSFADGNGDGVGDLPGITDRLGALAELGVDAVWLSPFYPSPQADAGYDVADYRGVDPLFGGLTDFDALLLRAHDLGLKVVIDLVPNHSSDEHPWFQQALAAVPGSPERARYLFRDGRGPGGDLAPNNWKAIFGGPAWDRVAEADGTPGQWYLHLFDPKQPDWDWTNPEIRAEFVDILRFWLDRGVDGFRVDVAHSLVKAAGLPDAAPADGPDVAFGSLTAARSSPRPTTPARCGIRTASTRSTGRGVRCSTVTPPLASWSPRPG